MAQIKSGSIIIGKGTILDSDEIGVTIQGYNANTVIDASYVHTDNNYTTTEKTKLSEIEEGAVKITLGTEQPSSGWWFEEI